MEPSNKQDTSTPNPQVRLTKLIRYEQLSQDLWDSKRIFESNPDPSRKKFFVTFPYPYMNGRLHMGHAYSATKAEFQVRYKRLKGYNCLWPFAYHCTGMPIAAAAIKLQREFKKHGDETQKWADSIQEEFNSQVEKAKADRKFKVTAKIPQYTILKMSGVSDEEIPKFVDADYWLSHFPSVGQKDLKRFGVHVDFRRSFITTEKNPYYDRFIRWQFNKLKEKGYIDYGKRPTIFAPTDGQPCADHDRAEGEGINPQEYTGIKLRLLDFPEKFESLKGRDVFLVAATLRPETMYGQTNCYILPSGKYGAYEMKNNEVFIIGENSARNMAFQGLTKTPEKVECIMEIMGTDLVGLACKAPLTSYEKIYLWPMNTISMEKATGVVTSVPSDAPDDWINLKELVNKPEWRKKWGLTDDMVLPYKPIPIIDIPELGNMAAEKACIDLQINGPGDKEKLAKAKEICYDAAFYKGVMTVGKYAGMKVIDAKTAIKKEMIESGEAINYWEPEGKVVSRSGELCVVSFCDQWYLKYGEANWRKQISDHVKSDNFNAYNSSILKAFEEAIDWLKEWAVSRNFGQGTRLPWDEQFLIESLSDSTIYMAFYTIAHFLQGDVEGTKPGSMGIEAKELNDIIFDYVFLGKDYNAACGVSEEKLKVMRQEFEYYYPLDLRVSAKDLVRNHLTMSLYNHAAIWEDPKYWPKSFFCNGYICVNGEKMSKQLGNFLTINDCMVKFGADATRVALADAGDTLDDANFVEDTANSAILKLTNIDTWIRWAIENLHKMRTEPGDEFTQTMDKAFSNEIDLIILNTDRAYSNMRFRDALKHSFYELPSHKEDYLMNCEDDPTKMNRALILKYIETQLILLNPICPHMTEVVYNEVVRPHLVEDKPQYISQASFPEVNVREIDHLSIKCKNYIKELQRTINVSLNKFQGKNKGKQFSTMKIFVAPSYYDWQVRILKVLNTCSFSETGEVTGEWKKEILEDKAMDKDMVKKSLMFGSFVLDQFKIVGKDCLALELPYDETDLIGKNVEKLKKVFKFKNIEIHNVDDAIKNGEKTLSVQSTLPGKPVVLFYE